MKKETTATLATMTAMRVIARRRFAPRSSRAAVGSPAGSVLRSPDGVVIGVSSSSATGGALLSPARRIASINSSGDTSMAGSGMLGVACGKCVETTSEPGTSAADQSTTSRQGTPCSADPDSGDDMWTVIRLLDTSADLLEERGSPSPRADAQVLLGSALGMSKTELYIHAQRPVDDVERERFRELVRRRGDGEPVAYITGTAGFWTLDLAVDSRVLVPRPETEHVVDAALRFVRSYDHTDWRIADVGTGSGALALALASELAEATVLAVDVSAAALEVARDNADAIGLRDRVRFVCGDLLEPLAGREAVVDVIVSNPPYVADGDPKLEPAVAAHEPAVALFAGSDGTAVIRRLVGQAARALVPGGLLLMEHGAGQGPETRRIAEDAGFVEVTTIRDYASHDRVLRARKPGTAPWPELTDEPEEPPDEDAPVTEQTDGERMLAEALEIGLPVVSLDD